MREDAAAPRRSAWNLLGVVALTLIPATIYLAVLLPDLTLSGALLLLLCEVIVVAATTSLTVAVITAVAAFLLTNWFLVPPFRTLFVASTDDIIVLFVFLGSAVLASWAVRASLRSQREAALAQFESSQLRQTVSTPAAEANPGDILRRVAEMYRLHDVSLMDPAGRVLSRFVTDGDGDATVSLDVPLADGYRLLGHGVPSIGQDRQVLMSMGNAALRSHEARALAQAAARAETLETLDRDRSALLASVGHDLRTPIAAITVAAGALASEMDLDAAVRDELEQTILESARRLDRLVTNLLDMSRLEAGKVVAQVGPTDVQQAVGEALLSLNWPPVDIEIEEDLPHAAADPGLLERVVANIVANAVRHGRPPVVIRGRAEGDVVRIDVVDHGRGLTEEQRRTMSEPFATSGDRAPGGLGLGMAIADRFCTTMGAQLRPSQTPGGGLTMSVIMRQAT